MATELTRDIIDQLKRLPRTEKLEVLAELQQDLSSNGTKHTLLELQGLGKEVWAGVDVKQYLRNERDSWTG